MLHPKKMKCQTLHNNHDCWFVIYSYFEWNFLFKLKCVCKYHSCIIEKILIKQFKKIMENLPTAIYDDQLWCYRPCRDTRVIEYLNKYQVKYVIGGWLGKNFYPELDHSNPIKTLKVNKNGIPFMKHATNKRHCEAVFLIDNVVSYGVKKIRMKECQTTKEYLRFFTNYVCLFIDVWITKNHNSKTLLTSIDIISKIDNTKLLSKIFKYEFFKRINKLVELVKVSC